MINNMDVMKLFRMPKPVSIMGKASSITNAFVNGIIPCIMPLKEELIDCLNILELDSADLRCAYCGDKFTEWDHLRPIVKDKRPTGYISDIYNLVPACGKCNQSKGNKYWKDWILSDAKLSPKSRGVKNLDEKILRLERYEMWKEIKPIDFESIVDNGLWEKHWSNCEELHRKMSEFQVVSNKIKALIQDNYRGSS